MAELCSLREITYKVEHPREKSPVVWCTCNNKTVVTGSNGEIDTGETNQYILITVMGWDMPKDRDQTFRLQTITSFLFLLTDVSRRKVSKTFESNSVLLSISSHFHMEDVHSEHTRINDANVDATEKYLNKIMSQYKMVPYDNTPLYVKPSMVQADFAPGGQMTRMPALNGWTQVNRLSFTPQVYWIRAVQYALLLTNGDIELIASNIKDLPRDVARTLAVSCLTSFAGNYPARSEYVDDRSLGVLKFDTNRDCDDMALTVCAVYNYMKKIGVIRYTKDRVLQATVDYNILLLAEYLHEFLITYYTCAVCVVCKALPHTADPNHAEDQSEMVGHVFAFLSVQKQHTNEYFNDFFKDGDLVESTRQSAPITSKLSLLTTSDGQRYFKRYDYIPGSSGIQNIKPLIPFQYPVCIKFSSADKTYLISKGDTIGASLSDLITTPEACVCRALNPQIVNHPILSVAHHPHIDNADQTFVINKWDTKLGILPTMDMPFEKLHSADWTYVTAPTHHHAQGFKMNESILYTLLKENENGEVVAVKV